MLFLGIDLGTSSVKVSAMDESGNIHASAKQSYPLLHPAPGFSEQNPEDWFSATIEALREILMQCDRHKVVGMSFSGQMHGLVLLDRDGRVLRPAILWNDGRSQPMSDALNENPGKEFLIAHTGNISFAGLTLSKILWVKENEPDLFAKTAMILLPKDYLAWRLCGQYHTEVSDAAGTLLFDVKQSAWSQQMCELAGLRIDQLPQVLPSTGLCGTLRPELAEMLGLSPEVKIIAGAADNVAAAVGCGAVGTGGCNLSLGTSGTIVFSNDAFVQPAGGVLHAYNHADGGYYLMGCILNAASCLKWWNESILKTNDYAAEQATIQNLGRNSVFFLPYLMGERSPHNDANARAAFLGMSMDTTRAELSQAVLEGVAFALRDCLREAQVLGLSPVSSTICGGGAGSKVWQKILANVLGLTLKIPAQKCGADFGAAILAAVGCGAFQSIRSATESLVQIEETVTPDPALQSAYNERYGVFRQLYPALRTHFPQMQVREEGPYGS